MLFKVGDKLKCLKWKNLGMDKYYTYTVCRINQEGFLLVDNQNLWSYIYPEAFERIASFKCECGGDKHNWGHSVWCPKYNCKVSK